MEDGWQYNYIGTVKGKESSEMTLMEILKVMKPDFFQNWRKICSPFQKNRIKGKTKSTSK